MQDFVILRNQIWIIIGNKNKTHLGITDVCVTSIILESYFTSSKNVKY